MFDRGFRRVSLIQHLRGLSLERYIVRLMAKVHVRSPQYAGLLSNHPLKRGEVVDLGRCSLRADGAVTVRVVGVWRDGENDPWWLATDLTEELAEIASLYDRRTSVEEQFRDGKSARHGAQMKWTHFRRPESVDRLWLLWALSAPVWTAAGLLAFAEDETVLLFSRSKGPRRSLIAIGMHATEKIRLVLHLTWRHLLLYLPQPFLRLSIAGGER